MNCGVEEPMHVPKCITFIKCILSPNVMHTLHYSHDCIQYKLHYNWIPCNTTTKVDNFKEQEVATASAIAADHYIDAAIVQET